MHASSDESDSKLSRAARAPDSLDSCDIAFCTSVDLLLLIRINSDESYLIIVNNERDVRR